MVVTLTALVVQSVAKRSLRACRISKSGGLIGMFVIREEVGDDCVGDGVNDDEDTRKIDVSKISVVCRGLVVFGLSDVDFGDVIRFMGLI